MFRKTTLTLAAVVLLTVGLVLPAPFNTLTALRRTVHPAMSAPTKAAAPAVATLARQPIHFEPSADQTQARFVARGRGYALKLAPTQAVVSLRNDSGRAEVAMQLLNANLDPEIKGVDPQASVSNYLIGNDPTKWRTAVPNFGKVKYEAVYPGIDLVYFGNQRQLEYDFIVAPGADPQQIKLAFTGAESLKLADNGDLLIAANGGTLRQHRPVVYQEVDGQRRPITGDFALTDTNRVAFTLGAYDRSHALVIDPTISYSTYLGASNEDKGYAIAIDSSGNVFTTGETGSSSFPTTAGVYDTSFNSTVDVFVTKLNTTGTAPSFSTFLGGSGTDIGRGIAVDSSGNVFVAGETDSNDTSPNTPFPVSSTGGSSYAGFQPTNAGGVDAFVTKLDSSGATLLYSSYLGGSSTDRANGVALDSSGNIYAIGDTASTAATFPETTGAFQTVKAAGTDAFVGKINPNVSSNSLNYLTYFGGNSTDRGFAIAVDSSEAYITGQTASSSGTFPLQSANDSTLNGLSDAFVAKFNSSGSALSYSTFLGGNGRESGNGIAVSSGVAYVAGEESSAIGTSGSTNFIVTNTGVQGSNAGGFDIFVAKYSTTGSLTYANIYGGSGDDRGFAVALDSGKFVVAGDTGSGSLATSNATQNTFQGGTDAFVMKIDSGLSGGLALTFFTYHAGTSTDSGRGIAVSGTTAYIAGYTDSLGDEFQSSGTFPVTSGVYQGGNQGGYDAFAAKLTSLP